MVRSGSGAGMLDGAIHVGWLHRIYESPGRLVGSEQSLKIYSG